MTKLTKGQMFRNRLGDLVEVACVPATRLKNELGSLLDQAARGSVITVTRHDTARAVLISYEEFAALAKLRGDSLSTLSAEFEKMLESMQSQSQLAAADALFSATPQELGEAAVRAARRAPPRRAQRAKALA